MPWRSPLIRECFLPSSVLGPVDRRALPRFASNCLSEIILFLMAYRRLRDTTGSAEMACAAGWERRWNRGWGVAGIGVAGILNLFSRAVNEITPSTCATM